MRRTSGECSSLVDRPVYPRLKRTIPVALLCRLGSVPETSGRPLALTASTVIAMQAIGEMVELRVEGVALRAIAEAVQGCEPPIKPEHSHRV